MLRWRIAALCALMGAAMTTGAAACGARTGLPLEPQDDAGHRHERAPTPPDARVDRSPAPPDVVEEQELPDVPLDTLPPMSIPDVIFNACPDAGATLVYVVTEENELLSFYPPTATFSTVGTLTCPTSSTPNSMAVNRHGIAYVGYTDGELFRVSTATAACEATTFKPRFSGDPFHTFGMGYVAGLGSGEGGIDASSVDGGTGSLERLFVASQSNGSELATIDTTSFAFSIIGPFSPRLDAPELSGTGDGRLYGFDGRQVAQIDPTTATVVESWPVSLPVGMGYAFAFWGGNFYIFTAPSGTNTEVHMLDPSTGKVTLVTSTSMGVIIDGAGVSTCAPEH